MSLDPNYVMGNGEGDPVRSSKVLDPPLPGSLVSPP